MKEAKSESVRGGGRGGGRGYGRRGGGGYNRDTASNDSSFRNSGHSGGQGAIDGSDSVRNVERRGGYGGPRGGFRGGRRGEDEGDENDNRRVFERHSGTGRGYYVILFCCKLVVNPLFYHLFKLHTYCFIWEASCV